MTNFVNNISRRDILSTFGSVGVGLLASPSFAQAQKGEESFTPPGVKKDLPAEALSKPRAIFKQRGDFDLDDPAQLGRARMKSIFSLDGSKSYVLRLSRSLICPPNQPAQTLLNELQFWFSVIELVDTDAQTGEPSEVITHSVFTRVAVDPVTLTPKRELKITETGQTVFVPDTLFAASVRADLATGREGRIDDGKTSTTVEAGATSPYTLLGPDVLFLAKGGHNNEGDHQPQVDMSSWATPKAELMNDRLGSATARYSFSGISRSRIFSWAQEYGGDSETQVLNHKTGIKSPTFEGLPDSIKTIMLENYPDRI